MINQKKCQCYNVVPMLDTSDLPCVLVCTICGTEWVTGAVIPGCVDWEAIGVVRKPIIMDEKGGEA